MIQRIQTVYLALGAVCLLALFTFDVLWTGAAAETHAWFVPALGILTAATSVMAIVAIFRYKNRQAQYKLVGIVQIATLVLAAVLYGGLYLAADLHVSGAEAAVDYQRAVMLALPALGYLFFVLARRGIHKDIALVRSMDRLR